MFGVQNTKVGTERLAYRLVWAYARVEAAVRPIDKKVADAELLGMTKAANAFGYGHTENHVSSTVWEIMRERPQPAWNATDGSARIAWEQEATAALTAALDEIL